MGSPGGGGTGGGGPSGGGGSSAGSGHGNKGSRGKKGRRLTGVNAVMAGSNMHGSHSGSPVASRVNYQNKPTSHNVSHQTNSQDNALYNSKGKIGSHNIPIRDNSYSSLRKDMKVKI